MAKKMISLEISDELKEALRVEAFKKNFTVSKLIRTILEKELNLDTKKDKEVTLETVLWNCRVALRGVGSTEKNRDAVIGLAFLKFAGDKFEKRRAEIKEQYGDIPVFLEKRSFYNAVNVFYLKETARWSYIVKNAGSNDIAVILDQAMSDIEADNPSLKGALAQNLYATLGAPK